MKLTKALRTYRLRTPLGSACLAIAIGWAAPGTSDAATAPDLSTITYNSALADGWHSGAQGGTSRLLWSDDWTTFSTDIPGADFTIGQTVTYTDTSLSGGLREFIDGAISGSQHINVTLGLGFIAREETTTGTTGWTIRSSESAGPAPILRITTTNAQVIDAVLVEDTYISSDGAENNTNFSGASTLNLRTHSSVWRNPLLQFDLPLLPGGDSVAQVDLILTSASNPAGTNGTPDIEVVAFAVPEPATLGLLVAGAALMLGRRRAH